MNVFIKYNGKTVGPYGVGGFDNRDKTVRSNVESLVMKAAQENGALPHSVMSSDMEFVFEPTQAPATTC